MPWIGLWTGWRRDMNIRWQSGKVAERSWFRDRAVIELWAARYISNLLNVKIGWSCLRIVTQTEPLEVGKAAVGFGDAACELVSAKVQVSQLLQVAEFGRHRSWQPLDVAQVQVRKVHQLAQLRGDRACQTPLTDVIYIELMPENYRLITKKIHKKSHCNSSWTINYNTSSSESCS